MCSALNYHQTIVVGVQPLLQVKQSVSKVFNENNLLGHLAGGCETQGHKFLLVLCTLRQEGLLVLNRLPLTDYGRLSSGQLGTGKLKTVTENIESLTADRRQTAGRY